MFLWTRKSSFEYTVSNFSIKFQVCLLEIRKWQRRKFVLQFFFSGYVDSWFNITTKVLFKSFFLDVFLLYINFSTTLTTFFVKMKKSSLKVSKTLIVVNLTFIIFSSKGCSGHVKCNFGNPVIIFQPKWIFSLKDQTLSKQLDFLTKKILQTFLRTRRLQFWQNWQKFFCQNLDFCSETENAPAITLPSKKTPKTFLWTRRLQFRQTCQKFYAKSPIFLLKDQKARANRLPSTKCPELVRRDTLNVVLTALDSFWQYFFLLKVQDFSAESRKIWKRNNCDLKVFP